VESHKAGFPTFPLLLEIPMGFPHSHRFDDGFYLSEQHCKGVVTDVSGPQHNAFSGTLTPILSALVLAVGMSVCAAFLEMLIAETRRAHPFSRETFFIFPGIIYCIPFVLLIRRQSRTQYRTSILTFLAGVPVVVVCCLGAGLVVACAMGDCI